MPNHVTNKLSFFGEESEVKKLLENVKGEKYEFQIDSFFPMPAELKNTSSPARIESNEKVREWHKKKRENKLTDWELQCQPMTERKSNELIKKYGANNWYDWALNNWGTKWGAYDVYKDSDDSFEFLTAWSTPYEAMVVLSKQYPKVEIRVRYYDEDFGANVGEYTLLDGKPIYFNRPEDCSEEAYRLAIDIDESDRFYTDDLLDVDESDDITGTYMDTCIKLAHEKGRIYNDYPAIVLNRLLELSIEAENYEQAALIKKYLENPITK